MLLKGKRLKQGQNDLARRAELLLARNFFTLDEIKTMSRRKALKVLKLISQIENKPSTKNELLELYVYFVSEMKIKKATSLVVKYFDFVVSLFDEVVSTFVAVVTSLCEHFNFRLALKKVFRI